jgi:prevent-host-death family protein
MITSTTTSVDIHDLPARLDEILALAQAGQEIVLVANGTPRAKLLPVDQSQPAPAGKRIPGLRPGAITLSPDFDDPLPDEFWVGEQ